MENQQRSTSTEVYKVHPELRTVEVSNKGNVRCAYSKRVRGKYVNAQGYYAVSLKVDGVWKSLKVHRLVAQTFLPPPCEELRMKCENEHHKKVLVKHLDNNPLNNCPGNLEWPDLRGNTKQAWEDGLIPALRGELNGRAVLTEEAVHKICRDYENGMMPKEAVFKYGISKQQATKIRAGYQWKHVWEQYDIKVNRRGKRSSTIRKE